MFVHLIKQNATTSFKCIILIQELDYLSGKELRTVEKSYLSPFQYLFRDKLRAP